MSAAAELPKTQKLGSLALLALLIGFFGLLVLAPIAGSMLDARESISAERERLDTLRHKRLDLAALEAELRAVRQNSAERPLIIEAPSSNAAWEKLQTAIRDLASAHEASITSDRMLRMEDDRGLKAIRSEATLVVSRPKVFGLIAAIEDHAPKLFIEKLKMVPSRDGAETIDLAVTIRALATLTPAKAAK